MQWLTLNKRSAAHICLENKTYAKNGRKVQKSVRDTSLYCTRECESIFQQDTKNIWSQIISNFNGAERLSHRTQPLKWTQCSLESLPPQKCFEDRRLASRTKELLSPLEHRLFMKSEHSVFVSSLCLEKTNICQRCDGFLLHRACAASSASCHTSPGRGGRKNT